MCVCVCVCVCVCLLDVGVSEYGEEMRAEGWGKQRGDGGKVERKREEIKEAIKRNK